MADGRHATKRAQVNVKKLKQLHRRLEVTLSILEHLRAEDQW